MISDHLLRVIAPDSGIRAFVCLTTELCNEGARRHQTMPTSTAALSLALTGGALAGATLKIQQRIALRFDGDGALEKIIVESDSYGRVRGYVAQTGVLLPRLARRQDISAAMGQGSLTVVKDVRLKDLAESVVPFATGSIAPDIEHYFNQSEQIPSRVRLGVVVGETMPVDVAAGALIQTLPGAKPPALDQLTARLDAPPTIYQMALDGYSPDDIAAQLFAGISYTILERRPLRFKCSCSRERSEKALISLGIDGIENLLSQGEAEVDCHFCRKKYLFNSADLQGLALQLDEISPHEEE